MPFEETVFRAAAPVRADVMASVSGARADMLVLTLFWSCKREDGSEYTLDQLAHSTIP